MSKVYFSICSRAQSEMCNSDFWTQVPSFMDVFNYLIQNVPSLIIYFTLSAVLPIMSKWGCGRCVCSVICLTLKVSYLQRKQLVFAIRVFLRCQKRWGISTKAIISEGKCSFQASPSIFHNTELDDSDSAYSTTALLNEQFRGLICNVSSLLFTLILQNAPLEIVWDEILFRQVCPSWGFCTSQVTLLALACLVYHNMFISLVSVMTNTALIKQHQRVFFA